VKFYERMDKLSYKILCNKFKDNKYMIEKGNEKRSYLTSSKKFVNNGDSIRIADIRCKYIKEVIGAILEQNDCINRIYIMTVELKTGII